MGASSVVLDVVRVEAVVFLVAEVVWAVDCFVFVEEELIGYLVVLE